MQRPLTTEECAFCFVVRGLLTGCNPARGADQEAHCAKCGSLLPAKGTILKIKYLEVCDLKGEVMGSGYLSKVHRDIDDVQEWYLSHCRGGSTSKLFKALGMPSGELKKYIKAKRFVVTWPKDVTLGLRPLFPIKTTT